MNDLGSYAHGFIFYEQLKVVNEMNDFGSWAQCSKCYE